MAAPSVPISVVVPTYQRADQLIRLLEAIAAQTGLAGAGIAGVEVVVADDGSTDGTVARATALGARLPYRVVVLGTPVNTGPAAARNRGWRASRGELVAFIDDDCAPEPTWLAQLMAPFSGAEAPDVVVGRTRPPEDQRHLIGPFSTYIDVSDSDGFLTCNIAYRRAVLEAVGGFDETAFPLQNGEDTDLGLRARQAGFRDHFAAEAIVWHDVHPSDFWTYLRDVRHLEGMVALIARHPEARVAPLHIGWWLRSVDKAVLAWWATLAVAIPRPTSPTRWLPFAGACALYGWQFTRSHYRPRSPGEWATSLPLALLADSWAVAVMVRSSVRHRTVVL